MNSLPKHRILHRQKMLLALLKKFGGRLGNIDMQKYLFLFTQKCQQNKSYEFVPYKYGCFSFQSYADRRRLIEIGALLSSDDWQLHADTDFSVNLDQETKYKIEVFYNKFSTLKGDELVREVYLNYPYFATRSEIAPKLLTDDEMQLIKKAVPKQDSMCFFTIGYEGISFEQYLNKLISNNIRVLVDVRRNPLSRKYGFSKKTLSETVEKLGMEYVHIPKLGIVSEKRQNLETLEDYQLLLDEYEKNTLKENAQALETLYNIFKNKKRVAITCFEAKHCMCHRSRVAKALLNLSDWKYEIKNI